jgi:RecA/RadA recombinase
MAKKAETDKFDTKELNKFLGEFLFVEPDTREDGTLATPRYPTGIVMLDVLLNGGLPMGKALALGTEQGIGKTTMLIQACGNIIEANPTKKVYYLDIEGGATYELFEAMGYANLLYNPKTNPDGRFYLLSVSTIQQIARVLKHIAADQDTAVVVVDSDTMVADQISLDDEALGTMDKAAAASARMWSRSASTILATIKNSSMCFVFIHQARVNLSAWHATVEATGCRAIKHIVSAEIWGKRKAWLAADGSEVKNRKEASGAYIELSTNKNRLTKPFACVEFPIFFGRGVSNTWAYKKWLEEHGVTDTLTGETKLYIDKGGAGYYNINLPFATSKVRGDAAVFDIIKANYDAIVSLVNDNGGITPGVSSEKFGEEEEE